MSSGQSFESPVQNCALRNWVLVLNSNFLILLTLQFDYVNLWYFRLWLFDKTKFIVWNIEGFWLSVAKIKELGKSEFVSKTQFLCVKI